MHIFKSVMLCGLPPLKAVTLDYRSRKVEPLSFKDFLEGLWTAIFHVVEFAPPVGSHSAERDLGQEATSDTAGGGGIAPLGELGHGRLLSGEKYMLRFATIIIL